MVKRGEKDGYSVASMYFVVAINELPKGVFFVVYVLVKLTGAGRDLEGRWCSKRGCSMNHNIPDVHCGLRVLKNRLKCVLNLLHTVSHQTHHT